MNVSSTKTAAVQSTQKATQSQKTAQANEQTQRRQTEVKSAQTQSPKPVINTQGQTTGRLVNVSA